MSTVSNEGENILSEKDQEEVNDSSSKDASPETFDDGKGFQSSKHVDVNHRQ